MIRPLRRSLVALAAFLILPTLPAQAQEESPPANVAQARKSLLDMYQRTSSTDERAAIIAQLESLRATDPPPSASPEPTADGEPTLPVEDALSLGSALGLGARLVDDSTETPAAEEAFDDLDELDLPIVTARQEVVNRFRERFFHPDGSARDEFLDNFDPNGPKTWAEVGPIVEDEASSFGAGEDDEFRDGESTTFTGRIFGLYTEATIQDDGTVVDVYFEID